MPGQLSAYKARLQERAQLSGAGMMRLDEDDFVSLKFTRDGEIKPLYGLTCIVWVVANSSLFQQLRHVKDTLQSVLEAAGLADFFYFLVPNSYHMTVCDIYARATPLNSAWVETVREQIEVAFATATQTWDITAQVSGIGLTSTITALVHFRDEEELKKVLHLENQIKRATRVNERDFLGHITLAYGIRSPQKQIEHIRELLHPFQEYPFGELTISTFDLTCFTDMNTFIPLNTVDFANGQVTRHPNLNQCQCQSPMAAQKSER